MTTDELTKRERESGGVHEPGVRQRDRYGDAPMRPARRVPAGRLVLGLDHVLLSGGTTFQGRGWYADVSACLKTQAHGVLIYDRDGR